MSKPKPAPKTRAFLAAIRLMPSITMAAKAAGIRRELHYRRLKKDEAYRKAFEESWESGCGALEDRAIERAMEGTLRPVFWKGKAVGAVREYPEGLMQFLLRGALPKKYREQVSHEIGGVGGGPVSVEVTFVKPQA
jgi:hypothetical protein